MNCFTLPQITGLPIAFDMMRRVSGFIFAATGGSRSTGLLAYRRTMLQHLSVVDMNDQRRWAAILERDRRADGRFFYGVTSTRVFCRPSCQSRLPRRDRVRFFDSPEAAEQAGFRPCRRCRPTTAPGDDPVAAAVSRAAAYLAGHVDETVSLAQLAQVAKLSPSHFQRQFKRALGVSPREYQAAMRADRFRRELRKGADVTTAVYAAGYGSPSRVYEAALTGRGVAPSAYRDGAEGLEIGFTVVSSTLGRLLVAGTANGVCAVKLGDDAAALEADLRHEFPAATLVRDRIVTARWVNAIVQRLRGSRDDLNLPLDIRGTAFQWRVWQALRAIPYGETRSYSDIARAIGRPKAVRAVAHACAVNPVCVVVPCHRVTPKSGEPGGYRWGADRKRRLLTLEAQSEVGRSRKAK
jgi:AraC family transcriptional regulator, regulatory protein of adaptative response / methylated-DNA-[protein]-cysteine methyltransferase